MFQRFVSPVLVTALMVTCLGTFLSANGSSSARAQPAWRTVITLPEAHATHGVANGVAIVPSGGAKPAWGYTVDTASSRVVRFSARGAILGSWRLPAARNRRARVAADAAGNVYVASGDNYVYKYSPDGALLARWGKFGGLRDIALDWRGDIYLAEYQARVVVELSPAGVPLRRWDTRRLWHGQSAGYPTGVAVSPNEGVFIATTCLSGFTCARRIDYLSGRSTDDWVDLLFPLAHQHAVGDLIATVGLQRTIYGEPLVPRDTCNNRFVMLQDITAEPAGRLIVGGILWPRSRAQPLLAVGLGAGQPGCTHEGIGPSWTVWPLPGTINRIQNLHGNDGVHGLAVDAAGTIYVAQRNHIIKLVGALPQLGK